ASLLPVGLRKSCGVMEVGAALERWAGAVDSGTTRAIRPSKMKQCGLPLTVVLRIGQTLSGGGHHGERAIRSGTRTTPSGRGRGDGCGGERRSTAGAIQRSSRRVGRDRVYGPGSPPRADGAARLPAGPGRLAHRRGRLPGDVLDPGAEGRVD